MIYHITTRDAWEQPHPDGLHRDPSLETEGFIHCSTLEQLAGSANRHFAGRTGLVILAIDPKRVQARIVYENLYGGEQQFPHIYGPLEQDAVTSVIDFPPGPDGVFSLPDSLETSD